MSVNIIGGIHGLSYVMKEHRKKALFVVMANETCRRSLLKDEVVLAESRTSKAPYVEIGLSNVIHCTI